MRTKITELLGIQHPIIQSAMGWIANKELVCAVCNAGALGLLAVGGVTPDELRTLIREIRGTIGDRPFGVNITPHRPGFVHHIEVLLEEKIPVWNSGLRDPFSYLNVEKPEGVIFIPTVGSVGQAIKMEQAGADAVIVQGWEAGGHAGRIASSVLIPEVAEAVNVPVIAAGGFCDGKGLVAAMALGAEGISMGTRFATAAESPLFQHIKLEYVKARDKDAEVSSVFDGLPMRAIRGEKMRHYLGWWTQFWRVIPALISIKKTYKASFRDIIESSRIVMGMGASLPQFLMGMETYRYVFTTGDFKRGYSPAGQVTGRIKDIPTSREIIERIVSEAEQIIRSMPSAIEG